MGPATVYSKISIFLLICFAAFGQEAHITPTTRKETGTSSKIGPDSWSARGFELKAMIARLYHVPEKHLEFPLSLDDYTRYDFEVAAPEAQAEELLKQAIQKQFHISITRETKSMEVFVMTATNPPRAAAESATSRLSINNDEIKAINTTMENVARGIEQSRDRFVVDETNLKGHYDLEGKDLAEAGLKLTPGRRDIEILVIRKL